MKRLDNKWRLLSLPFNTELSDALQQQHHAAQFLAMAGRHLIPRQPDDSNTNMEYIPEKEMLFGNLLPEGVRLGLQLSEMKIFILDDKNETKTEITLAGKTQIAVFEEIKRNLKNLGVDVSGFSNEMHYEIPEHKLDRGDVFSVSNKKYFIENTLYRHNAKVVLIEVAKDFEQAEPVRIWPHHFDTGTFIPLAHNKKGDLSKSFGLGLAIPDSMIDEPYFYLSFWSEKPVKGIENIKPSEVGKWMMPDWNGAVLKLSEILKENKAVNQHKLVKSFFQTGIDTLKSVL